MTIDDIKSLIAGDEHRELELKKSTGELKDAMHSACAFLNTSGGWLIFGVTPSSLKVVGQDVTDNTQREISNALGKLEPAVNVEVEYVEIPHSDGKKVVAMHFDGYVWGGVPYTYNGCPYYRVESTTKQMPRDMYDERLRLSKPTFFAWERLVATNCSLDDLDEERLRGAVRLGVERGRMPSTAMTDPVANLLGKLDLLTDSRPNNASVMLLGKDTHGYSQLCLRMARFVGNDKSEFRDNQQVEGNFFTLLDAGMSFFFKHLSLSGKIVGSYREEHLEVPAEALREALVNALCHRQYEKYNLTIGIAIYDDRIEISNPGVFPPGITPETIKQMHQSYPYNPIIAKVLYKSTFLENWGSGAKRIMDACREQGLPEPVWNSNGGFITITFTRPANILTGNILDTTTHQEPTKNPPRTHQENEPYSPSSQQVAKVVMTMPSGYVPLTSLMESAGYRDRHTFVKNYLKPAIDDGAVCPFYPEALRMKGQRYTLSPKAIEWKNRQKL